MINNQVAT